MYICESGGTQSENAGILTNYICITISVKWQNHTSEISAIISSLCWYLVVFKVLPIPTNCTLRNSENSPPDQLTKLESRIKIYSDDHQSKRISDKDVFELTA